MWGLTMSPHTPIEGSAVFEKHPEYYRPVIRLYYPVRALVCIADGLLSLAGWPFGYWSDVHIRFCEWSVLEGIKMARSKREREQVRT